MRQQGSAMVCSESHQWLVGHGLKTKLRLLPPLVSGRKQLASLCLLSMMWSSTTHATKMLFFNQTFFTQSMITKTKQNNNIQNTCGSDKKAYNWASLVNKTYRYLNCSAWGSSQPSRGWEWDAASSWVTVQRHGLTITYIKAHTLKKTTAVGRLLLLHAWVPSSASDSAFRTECRQQNTKRATQETEGLCKAGNINVNTWEAIALGGPLWRSMVEITTKTLEL